MFSVRCVNLYIFTTRFIASFCYLLRIGKRAVAPSLKGFWYLKFNQVIIIASFAGESKFESLGPWMRQFRCISVSSSIPHKDAQN